ncbi:hypothetical protein DMN50_34230, partial [Priestia megaterium]
ATKKDKKSEVIPVIFVSIRLVDCSISAIGLTNIFKSDNSNKNFKSFEKYTKHLFDCQFSIFKP